MASTSHADFIVESREHLSLFEQSMLALEKASSERQSSDCIEASLRAIHSLKGNAGFLGFQRLQQLAHATESVLENYRGQPTPPPLAVIEAVLSANDMLSVMIEDLDHSQSKEISGLLSKLASLDVAISTSHGKDCESVLQFNLPLPTPPASILPLMKSLQALGKIARAQMQAVDVQTSISQWQASALRLTGHLHVKRSVIEIHQELSRTGATISWNDLGATDLSGLGARQLFSSIAATDGDLAYAPVDLRRGLPTHPVIWLPKRFADSSTQASLSNRLVASEDLDPKLATAIPLEATELAAKRVSDVPAVTSSATVPNAIVQGSLLPGSLQPNAASKTVSSAHPASSDRPSSLRIQVELLDRLMNLVSELTLVRNQSLLAFGDSDGVAQAVTQRLDAVTSELQNAVLKTRMQPVENLFGRFPRMVRDMAKQLGKQVELVMVGQEVELDKTVLEQLSDPLTHLIRNSIDHGLEAPDVRSKSGKSTVGRVTLSAIAADGQVIIEIRDDGRGIDPNAVRAKVLALGLKTDAELQRISTKELYSYILLPGFSTAKQVSEVSGRGVGMDVVKTNVERLEGSLTIDSTPGRGTSMILRVPLTLAIIPCLIVTVGPQRFAVPQRGLVEIVCLYKGGHGRLERSYDTELYRLRDLLLPVVRFKEVLARRRPFDVDTKASILQGTSTEMNDPQRIEYILVLRTGGRRFGLLVDDVCGREEIVVKPMHPSLKRIGIFAGVTLMGDGRVALIADIDGIAEHAACYGVEPPDSSMAAQRDPADVHRVLLFECGPKELFALPLVQVNRIESIRMEHVEYVGEQAFITIDNRSTRIIQLDKCLNVSACECASSMFLLLPKFVSEPIGILISKIVDTESLSMELQATSLGDPGILGTAIVQGRLALFLDTQYLREELFGVRSFDRAATMQRNLRAVASPEFDTRADERTNLPHVLLVDDTPFFREVVRRYFEREGIAVTTAVDGNAGLEKLESDTFDLVVSDIEMPNLNGWEFCRAARKAGYKTPFLALTSLSRAEHSTKAMECGFDGFEEKLDHDRLMDSVRKLLGMAPLEAQHAR